MHPVRRLPLAAMAASALVPGTGAARRLAPAAHQDGDVVPARQRHRSCQHSQCHDIRRQSMANQTRLTRLTRQLGDPA
jgi:hypothetical protein